MQNKTNELSDAVVLFLGFGSASSPRRDHARLVQEFGATEAAALESLVVSLLEEVGKIQVDWSAHSLESAGEMARTEMHTRHPDLSDTALRALAWKFTFDWR
jgi:hypothetical protein